MEYHGNGRLVAYYSTRQNATIWQETRPSLHWWTFGCDDWIENHAVSGCARKRPNWRSFGLVLFRWHWIGRFTTSAAYAMMSRWAGIEQKNLNCARCGTFFRLPVGVSFSESESDEYSFHCRWVSQRGFNCLYTLPNIIIESVMPKEAKHAVL